MILSDGVNMPGSLLQLHILNPTTDPWAMTFVTHPPDRHRASAWRQRAAQRFWVDPPRTTRGHGFVAIASEKSLSLKTLTAGYLGAAAAGLQVSETWVILLALNLGGISSLM
jgi:hypothetical protein